ncbi:hypothetical protein SAMN05192553_102946 [Cyclobacterium xiamenense]|uniref:Uncharacterized protein n=1 Tax=Cyclobacterium xiamenense TaxID=1297121 RepID=A0A1H6X8B9_9BACT|nr:hypothetical protein [Cyclobacterium xiamenense]SEJ21180.1 hypothetical protein SAMN05192553_102946 [Cyclobacterium xiamenense]
MLSIGNAIIAIFLIAGSFEDQSGVLSQDDDIENITTVLRTEFGEKSAFPRRFIYDKVELNGDEQPEYLIGLIGPDFCGTGGCTMLVLSDKLKVMAKMTLVKYPVYVGQDSPEEKTNGFQNIYVRTGEVGFVKVAWNGKTYPTNPSMQPKLAESDISDKNQLLNAFDDPAWEF